jgi:hypothetical protein
MITISESLDRSYLDLAKRRRAAYPGALVSCGTSIQPFETCSAIVQSEVHGKRTRYVALYVVSALFPRRCATWAFRTAVSAETSRKKVREKL